jgi:signal transduction histidine kinase
VGLRVDEVFDGPVGRSVLANVRNVLETGKALMNEEVQGRPREDGPRTWLLSYYPVRTREGALIGVGGVVTEITERKRMEEELRRTKQVAEKAYEEARQAVRSRDEYLAIVAHDLRAPLVSIALSADGVKNNLPIQGGGAARHLTDHILRGVRRMERLIQDLLDAARIEGGRMALEVRPHPLESLLRDAADMFSPLAQERGVRLQVESAGDSVSVLADKERVGQVLSNLVGNALKFTPRGGAVTVLAEGLGDLVRLSVADNGPGLPADHLPKIFERFWQAKKTGREGTGLGLYIAKGIVEAHGGQIWAESAPGNGSTFHFTLPGSRAPGA